MHKTDRFYIYIYIEYVSVAVHCILTIVCAVMDCLSMSDFIFAGDTVMFHISLICVLLGKSIIKLCTIIYIHHVFLSLCSLSGSLRYNE